jgi:hypothetical protein
MGNNMKYVVANMYLLVTRFAYNNWHKHRPRHNTTQHNTTTDDITRVHACTSMSYKVQVLVLAYTRYQVQVQQYDYVLRTVQVPYRTVMSYAHACAYPYTALCTNWYQYA